MKLLYTYLKQEYAYSPRLSLLFISLIFIAGCITTYLEQVYYYDSNYYWYLGNTLTTSSWFNNYPDTLRGYVFPFLISLLIIPGKIIHFKILGFVLLNLANATTATITFSYLIPKIVAKVNPKLKTYNYQIIAGLILFMTFWWGYIRLPLTDIYASAGLLWIIYLLLHKINNNFYTLLIGALVYALSNTRPIYMIIIPIVMIYLVLNQISFRQKAMALTVFFIGFILISLPQVYLNAHQKNNYSLFPSMPKSNTNQEQSLLLVQLKLGLAAQRYETIVDNSIVHYVGASFKTLTPLPEKPNIKTKADYMNTVLAHPAAVTGTYIQHFINGLNICFNQCYVKNYHEQYHIMKWLNSLVVALALILIFKNFKFQKKSIYLLLLLFLLPALATIPMQLETRFFINAHVLFYAAIMYYSPSITSFKRKDFVVLGGLFAFLLITSYVLTSLNNTFPVSYQ